MGDTSDQAERELRDYLKSEQKRHETQKGGK